jgi:hypothetical protein
MLRPQSADSLYAEVMVAVDSGDDSQLLQARDLIDEFLERFPQDERGNEMQAISDETDLTRLARNLQRRASREGGTNQLNAIEQGFLDCVKLMSQDSAQAQQKLAAFVAVFGSLEDLPPNEKRLVSLAEFALRSGARPKDDVVPAAALQLQSLIQSAESSLSGASLRACYQNLLTLYGDKMWAAEQMDRIRQKLETEP